MDLFIQDKIGAVTPGVAAYRKTPGSLNAAASAAAYYAKRDNARMVVVEGNSYGNRVYHIARESEDLCKFTGMRVQTRVVVVEPSGAAFYALVFPCRH